MPITIDSKTGSHVNRESRVLRKINKIITLAVFEHIRPDFLTRAVLNFLLFPSIPPKLSFVHNNDCRQSFSIYENQQNSQIFKMVELAPVEKGPKLQVKLCLWLSHISVKKFAIPFHFLLKYRSYTSYNSPNIDDWGSQLVAKGINVDIK